jgi:hypothetical protein
MGAASRLAANSFTKTRQAGSSRELAGEYTGLRRNSRCEFGRVGRGQGAEAASRVSTGIQDWNWKGWLPKERKDAAENC